MFNHQYGIARFDKVLQNLEQQLDVGKVQTGCRFVQQIECFSRALFNQLTSQLDSLSFAARESRGGLPDLQIVQPNTL